MSATDNSSDSSDFSQEPVGLDDSSALAGAYDTERRLHMRAFDYWHHLKGGKAYPLFADLRADELAPFKTNCLLMEFNAKGTIVRFIGDRLKAITDADFTVGSYLSDFLESAFARALMDQFSSSEGRSHAAEFEFVEDHTDCRGVMLPFSSDGIVPNFVMVVSNFRKQQVDIDTPPAAINEMKPVVDQLVTDIRRQAKKVGHFDQNSRSDLYGVLAEAMALYEAAAENPDFYESYAAEHGLKVQARAPYTPCLKLVFGKSYDKTRLAEYAAALTCAARHGYNSAGLAGFLEEMPGGIKGCVQAERAHKRQMEGTPAQRRQRNAEDTLRSMQETDLDHIDIEGEFALVLVQKASGEKVRILGQAKTGKAALDSAIRNLAHDYKTGR
ncbi:hypothetical protein [Kordiimonas pumila]|uniref:Uncharacterized protein n=1 Tax=Kordiimonas pumila TaxID=2161677 RepID=A0ABV7D4F6_9PROT|nr:hypothetical protein [Kordiimonas pumila]